MDESRRAASSLSEMEFSARHSEGSSKSVGASRVAIAISATFTAEPLQLPLRYWLATLEIPSQVAFAPYAQVMQELLSPTSLFAKNVEGVNVLLLRLDDWIRDRLSGHSVEQNLNHVRRACDELVGALGVLRGRTSAPLLVFFCPPSSSLPDAYRAGMAALQVDAFARISSVACVHAWTHEDLGRLYPVPDYEAPRTDHIGHIPYTTAYFAALATLLVRRITVLHKPQYKVIAIDCDNTLWKGICGEDGPLGIELTAEHLEFQRTLVHQYECGMLLCLCSKNNAGDVEAVFRQRPEMPLREEHLISSRINWRPKSENLQSLAQELDLSLDSFIFIDDSPVECAEVRAHCEPVLVLQLPTSAGEILHFGNHVWAFDRTEVTAEATRRTQQYRENRARAVAAQQASDLDQFLASLELKVDVRQMTSEHLARAAELVQRTNQFNLTTIRRRASEIEALCSSGELHALVIHVRDRFGDYGLVGIVLFRWRPPALEVDTFVLSCRVLGRGVEHRIINELARIARLNEMSEIILRCRATPRNLPAKEFLQRSFERQRMSGGDNTQAETDIAFRVPVEYADKVGTDASRRLPSELEESATLEKPAQQVNSTKWHEIAYGLSHISDLVREIYRVKPEDRAAADGYEEPKTPSESVIAEIWSEVLGIAKVGLLDDFFALGGDSVMAVQVIARIESALGCELSLHDFFECPTVEATARILALTSKSSSSISKAQREQSIPLSYSQERLWFLDQLGLVGTTYNIPMALRLVGNIVEDALRFGFVELVRRHESLRTSFPSRQGVPYQLIADRERSFEIDRIDLSSIATDQEREARLSELMECEQLHRFDLSTGPLLRVVLISLGRSESVLLITLHHIIADGWSLGILAKELGVTYTAYLQGQRPPLADLPVQYADYAVWQRQQAQGALRDDLDYWRGRLLGAPPQLELPTDRPRPAVESFRGRALRFNFPLSLARALKELGSRNGATLFMVALAAYYLLLSRCSGQRDVVIGSPIAGRSRREVENLVGFFVNTLALRIAPSGDLTFVQLLEHVKEVTLGAYDHQNTPFEMLVAELRPERSLTRQPIFQAWLALQNFPEQHLSLPGATWTWTGAEWGNAHFDLTLYLEECASGISGTLEYASDLFESSTITRIAGYFRVLVEGIVENPDERISRLPMMTGIEELQLSQWNATSVPYRSEALIHELFEEQVEKAPERIAVEYESQCLTYSQLNARANQLASYLIENGVGADQVVGICVERSLEMVIGLLGILKAGGAYVPLDPSYPSERLAYMIGNAAPIVLLIQERVIDRLPRTEAKLLALDRDWGEVGRRATCNLRLRTSGLCSGNLAYVIYTSGSTGQPKGAMNEHRAVINRLQWMQDAYDLGEHDRVLQKTPFSFDVSVWEFFWTLLAGARLVVARSDGHKDPFYLQDLIERSGVTRVHFVPSMLQAFLDQYRPRGCTSVRQVVCSGEELTTSLQRKFFESLPQVRLSNLYGPTEAAVDVTEWECRPETQGLRVPIGRSIANTQMHILDAHLQAVPIGIVGEIYIGGHGVGRGYLRRPGLTAGQFLPDPFGAGPQARLYKTGDLGRWRSDGAIEYWGRKDLQVKIRGIRIELGEIESKLLEHSRVKEAVVLARQDDLGERRLVAYVVGNRSTAMDAASEGLRKEIVSEWETLYEETYGGAAEIVGPNFAGWISSYTGRPIPQSEMQEWLISTVQRIQALRPRRILEIGCGMGLLLQHLAPACEVYVGTDISTVAIEGLRRWMKGRTSLGHVELLHRSASELGDLRSGDFDVVVLNSVVQYFPDIEYLLGVVRESVRLAGPGGSVFLGDIRPLESLPTFHCAVQLSKAAGTVSVGQLRKRVSRAISQEKELVVDPQFFQELRARLSGIRAVEIQLKRGRAQNELIQYRYDVVMHLGERMDLRLPDARLDWRTEVGSVECLEAVLQKGRWTMVHLREIPNRRLCRETMSHKLISTGNEELDAASLRRQLNELPIEAVDPESLWELGELCGYEVQIGWSAPGSPGSFDVLLIDRACEAKSAQRERIGGAEEHSWDLYANDPLESVFRQQLIPVLREYLKEQLPTHMLPTSWVALRQLPLSPNGKLDRNALPAPLSRPEDVGEYVAPRTDLERTLANIWAQLLRVEQVGAQDNFFELGGHSLLIVQMMERLRQLGLLAELRSVYASPTLAALAQTLTESAGGSSIMPPNLIPLGCEQILPRMLPLVELDTEGINRIAKAVSGASQNIQDIYPLAPLQEGILFHHLLDEQGADPYARAILLAVDSRERVDDLVAALRFVIERHDVLRTSVHWEQLPQAVQVVHRHVVLHVEELVLDQYRDAVEQLKERMRLSQNRLDLRQAPLLRLQVAKDTRSDQWYALIQTHHFVFDNQSLEVMLSEVMVHADGRSYELPEPAAYRDFISQSLSCARTRDTERFFRSKLAGIDGSTAPFGLSAAHGDGLGNDECRQVMEPKLANRVRLQARRLAVSAATLFHAMWALVVAHTSGRDDVVFGTVLLGRFQGSAGAQRSLGMFINTLPLRLRLRHLSAIELLEQTNLALLDLLGHEQASLAMALRCSGLPASAPLFTALLNYLHGAPQSGANQSAAARGIRIIESYGNTNYPITLSVYDDGEDFTLEMTTDSHIDSHRMLVYCLVAMQAFVEALESAPQSVALSLSVVPELERRLLVDTFNQTQALFPRDKLIHEIFEEQSERVPDAPAVVYGQDVLTYRQLDGRANQLARYLRQSGVHSGECVPILMVRSAQMVIAQLAVLKSGGAYVPIDPTSPTDRQVFTIRDCGARRVLVDGVTMSADLAQHGIQLIDCTAAASGIGELSMLRLERIAMCALAPAYVMYTSGSTGAPKGVIVPHRAVIRLVVNSTYARIDPSDCVAHGSNPAFDASTFEIWGALLNGAKLLVISPLAVLDGAGFATMLRQHHVTVLWLTFGLFAQYVDLLRGVFNQLRYLLTGGEALDPSIVRRVLRNDPPQRLLNGYGPTECTTFSTTYQIRDVEEGSHSIPIGQPISNTRIYILDSELRPVPIGVTGELYIGGAGVALGYLGRPELTAQLFLPDVFGDRSGARLYKSGDLGRWRSDGNIEFIGRADRQIKMRGFRIELGEIEALLAQHRGVREAIVDLKEDVLGDKRLVAYITRADDSDVDLEEVRRYLIGALPDYMVPSGFVVLEHLPLTANGKVDRRALPALERNDYVRQEYEPPQGNVEDHLAQVWQTMFRIERIGRRDDFFELGGHSLLALKTVSRVNERLGCTLRVRDLYRNPTIKSLAMHLRGSERPDELVDIAREAVLTDDLVSTLGAPAERAKNVLITGCTGFVGRFLLAELLNATDAIVYCLVRAGSSQEAASRVRAVLQSAELWKAEFGRRIVAIPGDIRLRHLGVDDDEYASIARDVDSIFHCATSMNHLETYSMAKAANVESARELLLLSSHCRPKLINYVSTASVFGSHRSEAARIVDESSDIDNERHLRSSGYAASKWVAEKIFKTARGRGFACNIFRVGLVWADTLKGRYDELQREDRILRTSLLSGFGIENYRYPMPPTPVDYVARSIVALADRHNEGGSIFHISSSSQEIEGVFERCNELAGTCLELMSFYKWICRIQRLHEQGRSLPAVPLIEFGFALSEESFYQYERANSYGHIRFDCGSTHGELDKLGIVAPSLNDELLLSYIDNLFSTDEELRNAAMDRRAGASLHARRA